MNVLIACEESQTITIEMRNLGHQAFSCDLQEPSGGHPEWHVKGDVLDILHSPATFLTMDGTKYEGITWDLIIAHPPCTYLSNAGACRLYPRKGQLDQERYTRGLQAKTFFMEIYQTCCEHICIENPVPSKVYELPKYTQIIQPYEYGHPYSKKTCLWLKGLPKLQPTMVVPDYKPYVSCRTSHNRGNKEKAGVSRAGGSAKIRSKTFPGIARAMARQWAGEANV